MKKFLLVACAMCSMGASAQHLEWSAAQLPQTTEEGAAQGFTVYYDYLFTPANYTLCEGEGFKAY
ncbi:MAG: hypothetical protein J1E37_03735, partial [Prevotella sp.]|nr:hypothetical protein [Prevotella sp.]